jgi:hypothetical protein
MKHQLVTLLLVASSCCNAVMAAQTHQAPATATTLDRLLNLGVEDETQASSFEIIDRNSIQHQIRTFIPPLFAPAFTQHAYVLPPGIFRMDLSHRILHIGGNDFFANGKANRAVFGDAEVDRHLTDIDLFYGFDLDRQYLHGFTLRLNIPYLDSQTDGAVHPHGQPFISLENAGSSQAVGDIGLFLKKKLTDQGNSPVGLAVVAALFLPTGDNHQTFGSNGRISATRPQPPNLVAAQGFDAVQDANVANGTWGDPRCFFRNFNLANRALCHNNPSFSAPAAGVMSFAPGGSNADNAYVGDFPFNNGVFARFALDGRLPSTLQPGTGTASYLLGAFVTRQWDDASWFGRSAMHAGITHRFVFADDGVDFGDTTTYFASLVMPVYKDYLSIDLSAVIFDHQNDQYAGKIPEPDIHHCTSQDIGVVVNCQAVGDQAFIFDLKERSSFSGGVTAFIAPSLIYSPNPQVRITLSNLFRVKKPDLGPAPEHVFRLSISTIF